MSDFEWPPLPDWFWYPVAFIYGAIVGSFLNVVIYRLPLGKHLSKPPSHCPYCNHLITRWENIPLLSFLVLRARCSDCKTPISWRYFCVELFTGCFWTLLFHQIVLPYQQLTTWNFVFTALVASVLIALVFIDLDHFIAPDQLTLTAFLLGIGRDACCFAVAWTSNAQDAFLTQFTYFGWLPISIPGALAYGGLLFLVSFVGFLVYARLPKESLAQVTRRFLSAEEPSEPTSSETEVVTTEHEAEPAPPQLKFSPAFLCILAALIMLPVVHAWAILFLIVPLNAFYYITRRADETPFQTLQRFFRSDDLGLPGQESEDVVQAEEEARRFAQEAETGQHGAMGLGDVKLALGLGAILGPGMAILSLVIATFLGATFGGVLAFLRGRSLRYGIPFVPFMAAGAMVVMCFGQELVDAYKMYAFPGERPAPIVHPEIRSPRRRELQNLPPIPPGR